MVAPKIRAKTIIILGVISSYDVVNIKLRRPRVPVPSKKGKVASSTQTVENTKDETVTGHYIHVNLLTFAKTTISSHATAILSTTPINRGHKPSVPVLSSE